MLKNQIAEAKQNIKEATERGSWRFQAEWEEIDKLTDDDLLKELRIDGFDPKKALMKLRLEHSKKTGFDYKMDLEDEANKVANLKLDSNGEDKNCVIF